MKHLILSLCLLLFIAQSSYTQEGKVFDNLTLKSDILKSDRKYAIYLPPDYETSQRSYPVLYLLHGAGDDQTGWVQFGEVLRIADQSIKEGSATAMIIVMPDAEAGQRGYFNSIDKKWRYEDFFFEEFLPQIEKKYRIKSEKRYRAIAGLSMGGGGTFIYALRHPELFSSACPLSAYVGPLTLENMKKQIGPEANNYSDKKLDQYFKHHDALQLLEKYDKEWKNRVNWFIDCGDNDFLYEGNSLIHIAMRKKEIKHEFRIREGGHSWSYWRESLPKVLQFVSDTFHQH